MKLAVTPGRPGCCRVVGCVRQVEIVASFRASSLILELLLFTSLTGYRCSTGDHELHIYKMEEVTEPSLDPEALSSVQRVKVWFCLGSLCEEQK